MDRLIWVSQEVLWTSFDAHRAVKVVGTIILEATASAETAGSAESLLGFTASPSVALLSAQVKLGQSYCEAVSLKKTVTGPEAHRVNFGSVGNALRRVVQTLPKQRLWLLIDEWSEVPLDLQPLLADLLRRAVLPIKVFQTKIAAIEQRSRLLIPDASVSNIGLELGGGSFGSTQSRRLHGL